MVKCGWNGLHALGHRLRLRRPRAPVSSQGRFSRFRFLRFLAAPSQAIGRRHADRTKPYPVQCRWGKLRLPSRTCGKYLFVQPQRAHGEISKPSKVRGAAARRRRKFANAAER